MNTGETVFIIFMIILTPISVGSFAAVVWWIIRPHRETESAERVDKIWEQRETWGEDICRQLLAHQVEPDMTPEMVRLAWGEPKAIEPTSTGLERWHYHDPPSQQPTGYALFKNKRVIEAVPLPPTRRLTWGPWPIIAILLGLSALVSMVALGVVFFS